MKEEEFELRLEKQLPPQEKQEKLNPKETQGWYEEATKVSERFVWEIVFRLSWIPGTKTRTSEYAANIPELREVPGLSIPSKYIYLKSIMRLVIPLYFFLAVLGIESKALHLTTSLTL